MADSGLPAKQRDSLLVELRGYLLTCIGDADGLEAVEKHRTLRLTAGQVQCLSEALFLIESELGTELPDDDTCLCGHPHVNGRSGSCSQFTCPCEHWIKP